MATARTVIEEHVVAASIDAAIRKHKRYADLFDGLKWRIARAPQSGYPIPDTQPQAYLIRSYQWHNFPGAILIVYVFDEESVTIKAVKVIDIAKAIGSVGKKSA